jgi:hypothetical protein
LPNVSKIKNRMNFNNQVKAVKINV